jgi:hypothetical protein
MGVITEEGKDVCL